MAGRRCGAPRLCSGRRQVRRRSASWDRHRRGRGRLHPRARSRRGVVRRPGSDVRAHGHDRHRRRIQSVAHASGNPERPQGRHRRRGRPDRGPRAVGRCRARGSVRPSRHSGRRGRLRRPTRPAPAAECPQPSPGTRGAARPGSLTRSGARASTGWRAGGADFRRSGADTGRARAVAPGIGRACGCGRTSACRHDASRGRREHVGDGSDQSCSAGRCQGARGVRSSERSRRGGRSGRPGGGASRCCGPT